MSISSKLSERSNVPPFIVMDIMERARVLTAQGHKILHMEVGEPSRPPIDSVKAAIEKVLIDKTPIGYTIALGLPELRNRISKFYMEFYGLIVPDNRIIITNGSSGGFILAFLAALEAGENLGLPNPGYPAYRHTAKLLGIKPVIMSTNAASNWGLTAELIAQYHEKDRLNAVIVASPNNPTGVMMPRAQLKQVVDYCELHNITLISDEIYHGLTYAFAAETTLAFSQNTIVINSFSKFFGLTGWRVGWMVVPEHFVRPLERMTQNLSISVPYLSQIAALAALDTLPEARIHKLQYAKCREILRENLPKCGFTTFLPPDGAFYVLADIREFGIDSMSLSAKLLEQHHIATTPGNDFDPFNGQHYLRFSYAAGLETVEAVIEKLYNSDMSNSQF